jgi:hypothetical protein
LEGAGHSTGQAVAVLALHSTLNTQKVTLGVRVLLPVTVLLVPAPVPVLLPVLPVPVPVRR